MNNGHTYILFNSSPKPNTVTEISFMITDFFFPNKQNRKKWKKDSSMYQIGWTDKDNNQHKSNPLNYLQIAKHIRDKGSFDTLSFGLPPVECFWLDYNLVCKINWHKFDHSAEEGLAIINGALQQQYGANYPIVPKLNREGHLFSTLQPQLLTRIVELRTKLILKSNHALEDAWVFDLRTLIIDTISIIEITLNQLYNKAEYDPLPGWTFDKEKIGNKYAKFEDKISWVYKITGKHIDATEYLQSCNDLREIRNHLMHFDPPSLIITLEEATVWLNNVIDVGYLLIKIRQAMGAEISIQLLNFILQKEAIFNPESDFKNRLPIGTGNADYASSTWKKKLQ